MGRNVLELGAGAGLPSLAAAIWGAEHVVLTDYPDKDLVDNMQINVDAAKDVLPLQSSIVVQVSLEILDCTFVCSRMCVGIRLGCLHRIITYRSRV